MKPNGSPRQRSRLSQAEKLAAVTLLAAMVLFTISSYLALIPLILFLLLCIVAPFCPQWGFFLPMVSRSVTGHRGVALTFDDGPSPVTTPILLRLLEEYSFKATFFVIGQKAEKYPGLIADIIEAGHSIGNHSWQHDNLLMLRSKKRLHQDISKTQEALENCGVHPLIFRPPVGITNPRLKGVLHEEQLQAVSFSCRAFDHGNRKISNLALRITSKLKPGDIILLHDIEPDTKAAVEQWEKEIQRLFITLKKDTFEIVPLELLIGSRGRSVDT